MSNLSYLKEEKVSMRLLTINKIKHNLIEDNIDKDLVDFEILLDMLPRDKMGKLLMMISHKIIRG